MNTRLLDTGPLVGYLIATDPLHSRSLATLNSFSGEFITTSAVVAETMHFLKRFADGPQRLVTFLDEAEIEITESCQKDLLQQAVVLMRKYADTPMDFADASLVVVANDLHLDHICTFDRRGFSTFRTSFGKRFKILPEDA